MTSVPTTSGSVAGADDLPLVLDAAVPGKARQIHSAIRTAVLEGRLAAGQRLPATRSLAEQLGVRRNAIVEAYEQLRADGLVTSRRGSGTTVAVSVMSTQTPTPQVAPLEYSSNTAVFGLGRVLVSTSFQRSFRRAVNNRLLTLDPSLLAYGDPRGRLDLRSQLATYLRVNRGIICDPSQVMVVSGVQQGVRLAIEVIARPGDEIWMEEPGYPAARNAFAAAGTRIVPVRVDDQGLDVDHGIATSPDAKLAYVTPSHQYPLGVTMTMTRRRALLDWASGADAWIIEDDYDSEYRYEGPPLTALAGIDSEQRVIYIGTFSKMLFPALRMGFVVLPPELIERAIAARSAADRFPPGVLEGPIADLLATGAISRHVQTMRRHYRAARDAVVDTINGQSEGTLVAHRPAQGLHLVVDVVGPDPTDRARDICRATGLQLLLLSQTRTRAATTDGLVLGFSGDPVASLAEGARQLAVASARSARSQARTEDRRFHAALPRMP